VLSFSSQGARAVARWSLLVKTLPVGPLRTEFRTDRTFSDLAQAQAELDAWVEDYNHRRPSPWVVELLRDVVLERHAVGSATHLQGCGARGW
jgi:Integrase core domain